MLIFKTFSSSCFLFSTKNLHSIKFFSLFSSRLLTVRFSAKENLFHYCILIIFPQHQQKIRILLKIFVYLSNLGKQSFSLPLQNCYSSRVSEEIPRRMNPTCGWLLVTRLRKKTSLNFLVDG